MPAEALSCPNCGAPLPVNEGQALVLCVYCGTSARLASPASPAAQAAAPAAEKTLPPEAMQSLKDLLLAGRPADARKLYQEVTGGSPADAESAIDSLGRQVSLHTVRQQQLSPFGIVLVSLSILLVAASGLGWAMGRLNPWLAAALIAVAALQLVFFGPSLWQTLRFLPAKAAPATVLKVVPIGVARLGGQNVHTMKMLLDVRPAGRPSFQAEIVVPVREKSLAKAQPGSPLHVKYRSDNPRDVIFLRAP